MKKFNLYSSILLILFISLLACISASFTGQPFLKIDKDTSHYPKEDCKDIIQPFQLMNRLDNLLNYPPEDPIILNEILDELSKSSPDLVSPSIIDSYRTKINAFIESIEDSLPHDDPSMQLNLISILDSEVYQYLNAQNIKETFNPQVEHHNLKAFLRNMSDLISGNVNVYICLEDFWKAKFYFSYFPKEFLTIVRQINDRNFSFVISEILCYFEYYSASWNLIIHRKLGEYEIKTLFYSFDFVFEQIFKLHSLMRNREKMNVLLKEICGLILDILREFKNLNEPKLNLSFLECEVTPKEYIDIMQCFVDNFDLSNIAAELQKSFNQLDYLCSLNKGIIPSGQIEKRKVISLFALCKFYTNQAYFLEFKNFNLDIFNSISLYYFVIFRKNVCYGFNELFMLSFLRDFARINNELHQRFIYILEETNGNKNLIISKLKDSGEVLLFKAFMRLRLMKICKIKH